MSKPNAENNNDTPRFRGAFARLLAEIRAVSEQEFAPINIDVTSSVATVLGVSAGIRKYREQILRETPYFDITRLDNLELYALALGHAHTAYQTATEPPVELLTLGSEGIRWRTLLVNDANTLISRALLQPGVLAELKGVNGRKNVAFDLFALANVYRKHWNAIAERTSMKPDELDQVENLADRLLTAMGQREQATAITAQAVRDRQAAFTLFIRAYDEVRSVITFIRRRQADADAIAPSLYAGRTGNKKKPAAEADKQPSASEPAVSSLQPSSTAPPVPMSPETSEGGPFMHG